MAMNQFAQMSPEERAACGREGGKKSGEVRRNKRDTKETFKIFLSMPLKKGRVADIETIKSFMDLKGKNITVTEAMLLQVIQKALKGDLNAIQLILTLIGEKPSDKVDINATITKNPMADLTTDELRELISKNDGD